MKDIKFGIIGFGFMGHVHEEMLEKEIEGAKVFAICDIDQEQMEDAITKDVLKFTDYEELLRVEDIDTVLVVIPNHLHRDCVVKAAEYGKNIICEKPAAMNVREFEEMIDAVKKYNVRFTVHQQRRFDKDFQTMRAVYEQELIGNVYTVQSKLYGINGNMHDWHVFKKFGGGMLYDWGVHLIDQILYMIQGKVKSVYADMRNVINGEVDDYFKIIMQFENGVMAEIELGTYFLKDQEKWFERHWFIGGDAGSAYVDGFDPVGKIAKTSHLLKSVDKKTTMSKSGPTRSFGPPPAGVLQTEELPHVTCNHKMFFEDYVTAVNENKPFLVQVEEVKRVLGLMEAVRESAAKNKVIYLYDL